MDGLEALRRITGRWAATERPRIVAMTANAQQGDREECLAAGMDDYVTKPVRVDRLTEACSHRRDRGWAHDRRSSENASIGCGAAGAAITRGSNVSESTIDPATFAALQDIAGPEFADELVATFLEEAPTMFADLAAALSANEAERYRRAAHSLKSNATTFGALTLASMAKALELGGIDASSPAALAAMNGEYARVIEALQGLRHGG